MKKNFINKLLKIKRLNRSTGWVSIFTCAFFLSSNVLKAQTLSETEIRQQAEQLQNGDTEAKRNALHKLRSAKDENASRIATAGLDDKTEIVRATAPFSVLALPAAEAVENLLPGLKDKSPFVRRETAYALGKTRNSQAAQPLISLLQTDKDYSVKCAAAVALGEIGEISAVQFFIQILQQIPKNNDDFLRRAAARSIGQIAENVLLKDFLAQTEITDFGIFANTNRRNLTVKYPSLRASTDVLIRVLQSSNEPDDVKREAAFALGAIGNAKAVPVLQSKLAAEDYYLAEISRQALQKISPSAENPKN